jgi:hypothetical protein
MVKGPGRHAAVDMSTPVDSWVLSHLKSFSIEPTPCNCDGSCDYGCTGGEDRPSHRARQFITSWALTASSTQLHTLLDSYAVPLLTSLIKKMRVDVFLDILRCAAPFAGLLCLHRHMPCVSYCVLSHIKRSGALLLTASSENGCSLNIG